MSSRFRRLAFPIWLAAVRLVHRAGRATLVAVGIAAAAAMLAAVHVGTLIAQDREIGERVASLPPAVRAVRLTSFGVAGQLGPYAALDRRARSALGPLLDREPIATVLFRESTIAGRFIGLGAVDGLRRHVVLRSGRLPRSCRPQRCEVVQLRGREPPPNGPGLRLVRVGQADLATSAPFGDAIAPEQNALYEASLSERYRRSTRYHQPAPPPLFLADGVAGLGRSPVLETHFRAYGWAVPIPPGGVHPWSARQLVGRIERTRSTLQAASSSFDLRAPVDDLLAAARSSDTAGRRLLLLGGLATALLLAFAALAAARARPEAAAAARRLTWLGAPRWQASGALVLESAIGAVVAAAVGWAVGVAAAALVARRSNAEVRSVLAHSALSPGGLLLAGGLALAGAIVLAGALLLRPVRLRGWALSPLDAAAVGAAGAVAVALARGATDPQALARQPGTGALLFALPALVAFVGAVAAARLLGPALRVLERVAPARALALRLAALALARRPGFAGIAVAFLTVSGGLALFAAGYRSTLSRSQHEQAAFAAPADVVLREDLARLIPVRDIATPAALHAVGPDVRAEEVTRQSASIGGAVGVTGITVLGVDPGAISLLPGWRRDFSALPPDELARRIDAGDVELAGAALPQAARRLILPVRTQGGSVALVAVVETGRGSFVDVALGRAVPGRSTTLRAGLPQAARGGRVVALRFEPPPRIVERGADSGRAATRMLVLGPLVAEAGRRAVLSNYAGWRGVGGARLVASAPARVRLTLTNATTTYLRPSQPTDAAPVPVIASPALARLAGEKRQLLLTVAGEPLPVRVAAVAELFPGAGSGRDFAIADGELLVTALNTGRPGAGFATELWLRARSERAALRLEQRLRRPPFDVLELDSRRALEDELRRAPIARASLVMLAVAAVVAVALALVGLTLAASSELRDERGDLYDLETQGVGPARLRRQAHLRSLVILAFGLAGAVATGLALSSLVVGLVTLTANATQPHPPLALAVDWRAITLAAVACGAVALAATGLVTARAFRRPEAGRYSGVGE